MKKLIITLLATLVLLPTLAFAEGPRHFRYAIPDWCQRSFGAKLDTKGLISLAKELDADLDLVAYSEWDAIKAGGVRMSCVIPDMGEHPPFAVGFNDPKYQEQVYEAIDIALDKARDEKIKYVIVFTGNDTSEARDVQFERIVKGFKKERGDGSLIDRAKRLGITFVIEMLNSAENPATWKGHPGYLGDNTVEIINKVWKPIGSENFKLAFDVYHVVMMGEDPIKLVKKHHAAIGYIHVAGVMWMNGEGIYHPQNRGELHTRGQIIDYPKIMAVLAKHLPKGTYVLLEYIPNFNTRERVKADLQKAIDRCEKNLK